MSDLIEQSVLIVDDSEDIHYLVGARLKSQRLNLLHAYSGNQALALAREERPDLMLLDLDMPDTDGMTLCRQIKADEDLTQIPVIFLTGTMDTATKVEAFDLGAVDYVTKPFDAVELKARVRSALRTKRYHDLLVTKAQIDALTGLWNRGHFNDQLAVETAVLERHGHCVSLLLLDADHFKRINDQYGHPFGDSVLQRMAAVLNKFSRESDVVCRYGGEEFAIILRHTDSTGAGVIAERIRSEIAGLVFHSGQEKIQVTASFGIAGSDEWGEGEPLTGEAMLATADKALYRAKASGRNRVAWSRDRD
ncbi:MAG: diguanylate cyclase [Oleiphilaceae bacterium]|nr:diguanylate cyclase [Oleiphilaceae bacterium]